MFTVDEYIASDKVLPWMKIRMEEMRQLILTFPQISERIRYGAPFYDYQGMMLYMGPYKKNRLRIGFCNGVNIQDEFGVLKNDAGQTQIRHFELYEDTLPDHELLVSYISEAIRVNELLAQQKHARRNKKSRT